MKFYNTMKAIFVVLIIVVRNSFSQYNPMHVSNRNPYNSSKNQYFYTNPNVSHDQDKPLDLSTVKRQSLFNTESLASNGITKPMHFCQPVQRAHSNLFDISGCEYGQIYLNTWNTIDIKSEQMSQIPGNKLFTAYSINDTLQKIKNKIALSDSIRGHKNKGSRKTASACNANRIHESINNSKPPYQKNYRKRDSKLQTTLHPYDFNQGIMNAIKTHQGNIEIAKLTLPDSEVKQSVYLCKNGNKLFDFKSFFQLHRDLFDVTNTEPNKDSHDKLYSNLDSEVSHLLEQDVFLFNVLSLQFATRERNLIDFFSENKYRNNIKFLPLSKQSIKLCDKFYLGSSITDWTGSDLDYDTIKNAYLKFKRETNSNRSYNEVSFTYINTLTDMLLCRDEMHGFYVLKPKLWKLQLFIPELYFYLLWKIKLVESKEEEYTIFMQHALVDIRNIKKIIRAFFNICNDETETPENIELLIMEVSKCRACILNYLKNFHRNSLSCILYTYGLQTIHTRKKSLDSNSISMIFYLLTFTLTSFDPLLNDIKNSNENIARNIFINMNLLGRQIPKVDTFATLRLLSVFLSLLKNRDRKTFSQEPIFKPCRTPTMLIYQKLNDSNFYVLSLSNMQTLAYFRDSIYTVLKE